MKFYRNMSSGNVFVLNDEVQPKGHVQQITHEEFLAEKEKETFSIGSAKIVVETAVIPSVFHKFQERIQKENEGKPLKEQVRNSFALLIEAYANGAVLIFPKQHAARFDYRKSDRIMKALKLDKFIIEKLIEMCNTRFGPMDKEAEEQVAEWRKLNKEAVESIGE